MQLFQILGAILIYYVFLVGGIALTIYVVGVCKRFLRESRKPKR